MGKDKIFRIFVSSTFSDFKVERDALQRYVFPKLRELCHQRGARFQAIDLRWGVSEESAFDQRTIPICLEELKRCQQITPQPNFIILLGNRYGWRPLPYEIPAEEFHLILEKLNPSEKDLACHWYQCDENAIPPVYVLMPRSGIFCEAETWSEVEQAIETVLRRAVMELGFSEHIQNRYFPSATEQEILHGVLNTSATSKHVFGFFRSIPDLPNNKAAKDFVDLDKEGQIDVASQQSLQKIKDRLKNTLGANICEYSSCWEQNAPSKSHLESFCADVYDRLSSVIGHELSRIETIDSLDEEVSDHSNFARERASTFVGRVATLRRIRNYVVNQRGKCPFAIVGPGGVGKSALIAKAAQQAGVSSISIEVVARFVGATPSSTNPYALLASIYKEISRKYGAAENDIPNKYRDLVEKLPERLELATSDHPLVVFIDAVEQLSPVDNSLPLDWLPSQLPDHVSFVVSSLSGPVATLLERRVPDTYRVVLDEMSITEGEELLNTWLSNAGRGLQPDQWQLVNSAVAVCTLPLYLKMIFEEVRKWRSFERQTSLAEDVQGVLQRLVENLSVEHGAVLTKRVLGYLAAARSGLTEDELLDVLSNDKLVMDEFCSRSFHDGVKDKLPVAPWARLYGDLAPYLMLRSGDGTSLLSFYHRQFRDFAVDQFLPGSDSKKYHQALAAYFGGQLLCSDELGLNRPNVRMVAELPYQLTLGEKWKDLQSRLTDFSFAMAKCAAGMTDQLGEDYLRALEKHPNPPRVLLGWANFLKEKAHILRRGDSYWPAHKILLQLAWEHADDSVVTHAAEAWLETGECDWTWLRKTHRPKRLRLSPCLQVFEGHQGPVAGACLLDDGKILSWGGDWTLRLWTLDDGNCVNVMKHLPRNRGAWLYTAVLQNGTAISWGQGDGFPCVWNVHTGTRIGKIEAWIKGAAVLKDGRLVTWDTERLRDWGPAVATQLSSFLESSAYKVFLGRIFTFDEDRASNWNANSGRLISAESGTGILGLITLHGRILSWYEDGTLRLFGEMTGEQYGVLKGHTGRILCLIVILDEKVVTASSDGTLRIWDLSTMRCSGEMFGHCDDVIGVVDLKGGKILSWSLDKTLRLWDLSTKKCIAVLKGHTERINGTFLMPKSRAVSWSQDSTIRIWDINRAVCVGVLDGHNGAINGVLPVGDSHLLSWSDDGSLRYWDLERAVVDDIDESILPGNISNALWLRNDRLLTWMQHNIKCTDLEVWDARNECRDSVIVSGHKSTIDGVIKVPEGVLSWSFNEGSLRIWTEQSEQQMVSIEAHNGGVNGVVVLPNGHFLSWGADRKLKVWAIESRRCIIELEVHQERIRGVKVLNDGLVVSWDNAGTLFVWSLEGTQYVRKILPRAFDNDKRVTGLSELSDKSLLIWGDVGFKQWDVVSGKCISSLEGNVGGVAHLHADSADNVLAFCGDKALRSWSLSGGKKNNLQVLHHPQTWGAKIRSDGRILTWSLVNLTLDIWDGSPLSCQQTFKGHHNPIEGAEFLPDNYLFTWSSDELICWAVDTGTSFFSIDLEYWRNEQEQGPKLNLWGSSFSLRGGLKINEELIIGIYIEEPSAETCSNEGCLLSTIEISKKSGEKEVRDSSEVITPSWDFLRWRRFDGVDLYEGRNISLHGMYEKRKWLSFDRISFISDGRVLAFAQDIAVIFDDKSGCPLERLSLQDVAYGYPDWLIEPSKELMLVDGFACIKIGAGFGIFSTRIKGACEAVWHGDSGNEPIALLKDGRIVFSSANRSLSCVQLHKGNRDISLVSMCD